jgi:hypothetical protein
MVRRKLADGAAQTRGWWLGGADGGVGTLEAVPTPVRQGGIMGKTGRKRRARRKKNANHGKRPNA